VNAGIEAGVEFEVTEADEAFEPERNRVERIGKARADASDVDEFEETRVGGCGAADPEGYVSSAEAISRLGAGDGRLCNEVRSRSVSPVLSFQGFPLSGLIPTWKRCPCIRQRTSRDDSITGTAESGDDVESLYN